MADSQYISVRETAQMLGVSEKKIMDMVETEKLHAYKIADQFLRLKRSEVLSLRNSGQIACETVQFNYTTGEKIKDFFYFNDFYLISTMIILVLISIIFYY